MAQYKSNFWIFDLNWLVMFNSVMGETSANNTVNQRFLVCMDPNACITSFKWCRYMITCLNRTTQAWARNDGQPIRRPIVLLAAVYAYDTGHVNTSMSKGS
ncbi:hypothetical protein HanRHA438_Chr06g0269421 [Helianthus annuus]|nr:hypothetical protein HanHA300_Chr06g0213511 [Helianthus annuus]KAJ0738027.1 hypothetical protein HanLR1_Chr06g0213461 [Helianthus annuus]KAJ0912003.1 hypothetical protein HanRHA438_Chr06g0269421 [Helianthus annuus]